MKEKYIAPIFIDIPDLEGCLAIGELKLRKITEEEKIKYLRVSNVEYSENGNLASCTSFPNTETSLCLLNSLEILEFQSCQYVVECHNEATLIKELKVLLLALRLYKEGKIFAPIVFRPNAISFSIIKPTFINETIKYTIHKKDFYQIKKIFTLIKKNNSLILAFERFNNALTSNTNKKNSFIDFVTILESIFLKNSNRQELAFKFALYSSYILKNKLKTNVSFNEMKNIYNVRSELVHSGKSKKYSEELHNKNKMYTRRLLLWTLKNDSLEEADFQNMLLNSLKITI